MNFLKFELQYSTPFWNARVTNEGDYVDFDNFDHKIDCYGNFL